MMTPSQYIFSSLRSASRATAASMKLSSSGIRSLSAATDPLPNSETAEAYISREDKYGAHNYHPLPGPPPKKKLS